MHALQFLIAMVAAYFNYRHARGNRLVFTALTVWTTLSLSIVAAGTFRLFEWVPAVEWVRAFGVFWFVIAGPLLLARSLWRHAEKSAPVDSGRRMVLRAGAVLAAAPLTGVAFAIREAHREPQVRELTMPVFDLHPDLEGLRLVQISDIHLSPFFSREELRRVIDQANSLSADLALVTGDLISSSSDPLDQAIAELRRLRARAGIYGCLGNHEILAGVEALTATLGRQNGIRFLRSEAEVLHFGKAKLNVAGVDYQRINRPYLVGAQELLRPDTTNLLLSHSPDVFPVAAKQGWDVTLSGHTHGGQVQFEYVHPKMNPARFSTPFVYGQFRQGRSSMFVTSGLGTIGIPARLGAKPEIALIRLTAASAKA